MSVDPPSPLPPRFSQPTPGPVASLAPGTERRFDPGAMMMVEAADYTAAQDWFMAVVRQAQPTAASITKLAPGLYFAQVEPTGRYWIFSHAERP